MKKPTPKRGRPALGRIRLVAGVRPETFEKINARAAEKNATRGDVLDEWTKLWMNPK